MNSRKFYEKSGKIDRYYEVVNNWKKGYRKRTGAFRYDKREWTIQEDKLVMLHKIPDRELSVKIHRSVSAIQIRRSRLKAGSV